MSISIHALREEGDAGRPLQERRPPPYFYPRPPRGGRHLLARHALRQNEFLSTPSARRATRCASPSRSFLGFLSTPSARRATRQPLRPAADDPISIHALREEGDT